MLENKTECSREWLVNMDPGLYSTTIPYKNSFSTEFSELESNTTSD